jgi:predicted  nucleic acid-binding Zn-ribbon protein
MTSPLTNEERDVAGNLDLTVKAAMINLGEKIAWGSETGLMHEAAAEITRLRAKVERMREALEPFAMSERGLEITIDDLRRARAARGPAE